MNSRLFMNRLLSSGVLNCRYASRRCSCRLAIIRLIRGTNSKLMPYSNWDFEYLWLAIGRLFKVSCRSMLWKSLYSRTLDSRCRKLQWVVFRRCSNRCSVSPPCYYITEFKLIDGIGNLVIEDWQIMAETWELNIEKTQKLDLLWFDH